MPPCNGTMLGTILGSIGWYENAKEQTLDPFTSFTYAVIPPNTGDGGHNALSVYPDIICALWFLSKKLTDSPPENIVRSESTKMGCFPVRLQLEGKTLQTGILGLAAFIHSI